MLCAIIYAYKSIFCNDYLIELGPPINRYKLAGYKLNSLTGFFMLVT